MDAILKNRVVGEKDAVMFDIDDTLIFTNGMYVEVDESDFEYELASSEDDESESDVSLDDEEF